MWSYNTTWIEDCDSTNFVLLSFLMNDVKIKEGKLSNLKNNVLVTTSIGLKTVDNYEILIWGDSNASGYYNYEVVIKK